MRWKTTGFYYGAQHWFAFLRLSLLYLRAACLQINTSASDVVGNKTSSAYIFIEPSPSLRTLVNTGALIVHVRTTSFQLYNDIPSRSTLKVPLKRNFRIWDFCIIIKFEPYLQALWGFFGLTERGKLFSSPLNSASRALNWRPSWRGQNSLVTSRVVYISELRVNP